MPDAPFEFDPLLHQPARLKIMMLLASTTESSFNALAKEANLTAGNLATHLRALEVAGYVESRRGLVGIRGGREGAPGEAPLKVKPRMRYAVTPLGRDALRAYCRALEAAVRRLEAVTASGPVAEKVDDAR